MRRFLILLVVLTGELFPIQAMSHAIDSVESVHNHFRSRRYIAPAVFGLATVVAWRDDGFFSRGGVYNWRQENYPQFSRRADNVLQYLPAGAMLLSEALTRGEPGHFKMAIVRFAKAEAFMFVMAHSIKNLTSVERPSGSNDHSFPSGHTSQAFLSATYLHRELSDPRFDGLKGRKWIIASGYVAAATVGTFRILNNAHWLTDVLAGAAVGMLTGNLAYDIWPTKPNRSMDVSLHPYWNGTGGISLTATFK